MTVTALVTRNDITATASQTSFTYTFRVLAATDMDVYQNGVLLSSGYTVNNVGNTTGGTVVLDVGVPVGQIVSLVLAMPLDRTTNYQNSGKFLADDVNEDFDKIYIGAVQNENEGGRSLRLKDVEPPTSGVDMTIPLKDDRKGKLLSFNSVTGAPEASTLSVLYDSAAYTPYNFTGDGSTVAFTLGSTPNSENNTQVYIDGVYQQKDGYNVSGAVLTFSVAPPNLSTIEVMVTSALAVGATSSDLVSYTPAGTGAVATTVQAKLRESVSVKDFGAVGNGSTNDTAAIQAAIDTGKDVFFPEGFYLANNLTVSTDGQQLMSDTFAQLSKNANGPLITVTGREATFTNLGFRGDAATPTYTGDNIYVNEDKVRFIGCGSRWAYGRALRSEKAVNITSSKDIWQSANGSGEAEASFFDIEIGNNSTATLYGYIDGITTSQATGGIKYINIGSCFTVGSQFGKLSIQDVGSPSGINGGNHTCNRILGDITLTMSNTCIVGNTINTGGTVTFDTGAGNCTFESNVFSGTIINGSTSNYIVRNTSGSGSTQLTYGADAASNVLTFSPLLWTFDGDIVVPNTRGFDGYASDGTTRHNLASIASNNRITFGSDTGAQVSIISSSAGIYLVVDGTSRFQATESQFRPHADNAYSLGNASQRFSVVYAGTGTINTSDAREKTFLTIEDAETSAALEIKANLRKFKFNDAIESKGDGARIHFGASAQQVGEILTSHGLTPEDYAFYCYDEWEERQDKDGNVELEAGNRYGIRYEELLSFIIAAL